MTNLGSRNDENLEWELAPLKSRIFKNVAISITASIVVFIVCVAVAVAIVAFKPKSTSVSNVDESAAEHEHVETNFFLNDAQNTESEQNVAEIIYVYVTGMVENPGVYELEKGARAQDAVEAAGGVLVDAKLESVNLAREINDGEQLHIPDEDAEGIPFTGGNEMESGLVSINNAGAESLETLHRIGPALAQRIIEWREENGGFNHLEDLLNVSGIGPKLFEGIRDQVVL